MNRQRRPPIGPGATVDAEIEDLRTKKIGINVMDPISCRRSAFIYLIVFAGSAALALAGCMFLPESRVAAQTAGVKAGVDGNPGRLKICKIAGTGVPVNTLFRFTVTGTGATTAAHPQAATYGPVTRTVDVRAGDPALGGTCEFVPGLGANEPTYDQVQTFVNGTPITIVENGLSPANAVPQIPGQLRVSMVRVFGSAFVSADVAGLSPNPDTSTADGRVARAVVAARSGIVEVDFSAFRFNPTVLKVCKIGLGAALGQQFTFTVAVVSPQIGGPNPGTMFAPFSQNVTITAGPDNGQGGNCAFVNGSALPGGAFSQGSSVAVVEAGSNPIVGIASPSAGAGGLSIDIPNRRALLSGPAGMVAGINSVVFTNTTNVCRSDEASQGDEPTNAFNEQNGISCTRVTRFDFDGDTKADPAVYRLSTGVWTVLGSSHGDTKIRQFGAAGDVPVPGDYDGDGRTDYSVWRPSNGRWYIQGTTNVYEWHNWGVAGDIPQTGDWDGDGRADLIIYRPSNGRWYIKTRNNQFQNFQFGISTDVPYAADYDGDGLTDAAVFRNGTWYTLESTRGFRITQFGQAGDEPVPADYDGDGKDDLAVFRGGIWYVLTPTTYTVRPFGQAADIPVPADYNGDGRTDLAVYRQSEGRWYGARPAVGEYDLPIILGGPGYIPVQAPITYRLP